MQHETPPRSPAPLLKTRQPELDVMKGLAIMFMVLIHSFERYSPQPLPDHWTTYVLEFLCCPGAPIFMFLLGLGIVYTGKNKPRDLISRGFKVFIIGYVLNFTRGTLLYYLMYLQTGNTAYYSQAIHEFWGIDILPFAGLVFIFFGLAARLKFRSVHYVLSAVVFALVNLAGAHLQTDTALSGAVLGLFWGTSDNSYFPFFTWSVYPLFGYVFGALLIRSQDKPGMYRTLLTVFPAAAILFIVFSFRYNIDFGASDGLFQFGYYHHDLMGNLILLSMALSYIGVIALATPRIPAGVQRMLTRWSRNIINMYCISWVLIYWSTPFVPQGLALPLIIAYFLAVLFLSDFMAVRYKAYKARYQAQRKATN